MSFDGILCVFAGIMLLVAAIYIFFETRADDRKTCPKAKKALKIAAVAAVAVLVTAAVLELAGIFRLKGTKYIFVWTAGGVIFSLWLLFIFIKRRRGGNQAVHTRFLPRLVIVLLALELFVFNFNAYKLMSGRYPEWNVDFSNVGLQGFEFNDRGVLTGGGRIEIEVPDIPVGTLTIAAVSDKRAAVPFSADFTDETYSAGRYGIISGKIICGWEKSYTVPVNASGNLSSLSIRINSESGETITVERISLNTPIGLHVSPLRFFILCALCFGFHMLLRSPRLKNSLEQEEYVANLSVAGITAALIFAGLFLCLTNSNGLIKDFSLTEGNQITQELVDAFKKGQVHLLRKPEPELLALENPYDWSQRFGINYAWDHLLYNGKYYSYYGIAPVLLLFLPYNLLTGYYFPSCWAIFLFSSGGIVFISLLYMHIMKKFHKKIPLYILLSGLLIILFSCGVWYCLSKSYFYEISQCSGFLFVTSGAYFLLKSNVIGNGKVKLSSLCLSSALLSLAVLSRPTNAVYCAAALVFIGAGLFKWRAENGGKLIKYLVLSLLPYMVFGAIQMIYNYLRFGSVFDFGIQYSLTINDFTKAEFHLHFAMIGFFNYLFALPQFIPEFPFFESSVQLFSPNGYYFVATNYATGLLFTAPPVCALLLGGKALRKSTSPSKKLYTALICLVSVVAPFIIIFSIWESGYGIRYSVDFAWQMVLGALIVLFTLYAALKSSEAKKLVGIAMVFALAVSFVINFAQIYNWVVDGIYDNRLITVLKSFERLFEFWL